MLLQEIKGAAGKNSQFGTKWVHRGTERKKIKAADLDVAMSDGWVEGRVPKKSREEYNRDHATKRLIHKKSCVVCGADFVARKDTVTCSKTCAATLAGPKVSATFKERGSHAGWHYRKGETSYPEQYFEDVFKNENIAGWVREKKVGRWFIDFAFEDKKIAVEIDGRQHDDRAEMDKRKDDYLTSQGWRVIRVRWYNPRTESGKSKLHPQVKSLLDVLRHQGLV